MPSKAGKKTQGSSLYKTFVDAYMKAHPDVKRSVRHHDAQVEWNEIKSNEELVKEKIEEYLEIYNKLGAPAHEGLARPPSPVNPPRKDNRGRPRKNSKNVEPNETTVTTSNKENSGEKKDNEEEEWNGLDDLDDDDDDDDEEEEEQQQEKKKKKKKSYYVKKRKPTDEDIIEDPSKLAQTTGGPLEPLPKKIRQPAQERAYKELSAINERIASLVQVRQMGLSTPENKKQLKQLMVDRKKKAYELKRLQSKQRASNKYRNKQKKIVDNLLESKPELGPQLNKLYRRGVGRPRVEEQCPDLLQIIEEIAKVGGASDDRRRSETIRPCLTLDDLREKIKQRGYDIKRTTLYYRLLPHRASSIEGRRHIQTVPVRLRRAQNDEHGKHEDGHFATATIRYMKDLASIFGNDCVFYLSQDDKCKVPLGLPAARVQAPMLMHLDYRIRLPDHDWTVAPRHQLTPSVYAACLLSEDGDLGYSGPTYIAVRSAKHDQSNADSHAVDFDRLVHLKEFEKVARDDTGQVKPIVIVTVDGGPDENPRFPKTLVASIRKFKKYDLDALFCLTHAPGQSAYNIVERRMAPLSHDLAGLILPHDHFGSHLNDSGATINVDLEKLNFRKAGQILAETWNQTVIDGYPCFAEYINPPATSDDERRQIDVKLVMDELLREVCAEEEAEEGHESRVHASDEYYQENARSAREKFGDIPKYDIDEYWCAMHVLQTQYTLQIVRCNSVECCGPWRSNYVEVFPHRFLPSPVPFERTPYGVRMAEKDYQKGQFYGSLFQRIQFHGVVIENTQNEMLPFDYCCSSVKKEIRKRICKICNQYIPSAYRMKNHYRIHAQHYEDFDHDQDDTLPSTQPTDTTNTNENQTTTAPPVFKTEMLDWLRSDFDDFDLGPAPTQLASDRVTRSMKKLNVEEKEEDNNQDWVHVE
ncbi:unnamed protein product [Rotaria socialis]|uniref:C2H2-type domain-containing protein n=1 Tax=Rotaria socialis TaxID=392032 RepID=A0A819ABP4_9BILA|nr:unnamed protein product [Rotaria socialis]CAF3432315.1 unnamed protein product [Rotaria socialis]CAF3463412.1 unnamed protein product [Rotaria socialis]CAF3777419.1 unnamed protein product [Rotaria socialis]CAF3798172.1 unnamed protein product [Rotaria socialis]